MGFADYEAYTASIEDTDEDNAIRAKIKAQISIAEPDPQ
jgi:hypothetical protein